MKTVNFLFLSFLFLMSCGGATDTEDTSPVTEETTTPEPQENRQAPPQIKNDIIGYYVGLFEAEEFNENKKPSYSNLINISIDKLEDGKIYGHSVVAGNNRPFEGTYTQGENTYNVEAKEPGDDRYDGFFKFSVDVSKNTMTGNWLANDRNLAVTGRSYNLKKKIFQYDPSLELSEYIWETEMYDTYDENTGDREYPTEAATKFNASTTELTKKDIENLYKADLEIIRNSIYAKHGYSFKNRRMRYFFDHYVEWYIPVNTNILADLTDLEKKNIDLLKRYEDHAEAYYDYFGR